MWTVVVLVAGVTAYVLSTTQVKRTPIPASATAPAPAFLHTIANTAMPSGSPPGGMVWIPGGEFSMGAQDPPDMNDAVGMQATTDSRPIHRVYVDGF